MTTQHEQLDDKYRVHRNDGDPTGKHEHCRYFVLDPEHDEHARTAIRAYADTCSNRELAVDLQRWLATYEIAGTGVDHDHHG